MNSKHGVAVATSLVVATITALYIWSTSVTVHNSWHDLPSRKLLGTLNVAPVITTYPSACKGGGKLWGNDHAGGWNVCTDNIKSSECVVYSFGLGADWSFDNAAEESGCEVHGFDPSGELWRNGMHGAKYSNIDYAQQYPSKKKHFHSWGLGVLDKAMYPPGTIPQEWPGLGDPPFSKSNSAPWDMRSLEKTMLDLGQSSVTILKIDVEGAEWSALASMLESKLMRRMVSSGRIGQLLIEWHWDPNTRAFNDRHRLLMDRLKKLGLVPWNVERHKGSDCCLDVSYIWVPHEYGTG
mmetsp:Transcript_23806/g.34906  ORF Transcript_23806/g.34906 Transcript_23806/m.34906 type:complete len:295 (+) Transcript_23806:165-1049(+)|eukprot:CAMPEP_0185031184 /NCGR_PEP_ID=MMETSP1103-20130426/18525_1 /TAXON_ID=36769 /ORGANISM="Paraphysomonas bandaiensis, Strain Caron Lab Isolate" /LENGTH=294 /DNA_ID=CAMNT_0027566623 /DNA_START=74 /DNA_END=958 /DNA_ORIENTATION=+